MGRLREFADTSAGRFLFRYVLVLLVGFALMALRPVNDTVINPYTTFVARQSAVVLNVFGEHATVRGQILSSPRFAVQIYNGCNGLEAILIFVAGVAAFPATAVRKGVGVLAGFLAIQVLNTVRVVSLFYIGILRPQWFSFAHVFVWQSLIIIIAIVLWLVWVRWVASAPSTR